MDKQSRLQFEHWLSVGVNQKAAFYTKECQLRWVDGLNSP